VSAHPKIGALITYPEQPLFADKLTVIGQRFDPIFARQVNEDFHQCDLLGV